MSTICLFLFRIPLERHLGEVRRAISNENLFTIAYKLSGPNCFEEWTIEAKRPIPLLPRDLPLTAHTTLSNSSAEEIRRREKSLPDASNTRSLQLVPEVFSHSQPAQSSISSPHSIKCDNNKSKTNKRKYSNISPQNKRIRPNDLSYNSAVTTNDYHCDKQAKEQKLTRKTLLNIKSTTQNCVSTAENNATSSELNLNKSVLKPNLHIITIRPDTLTEPQVSKNLKSSSDRAYSLHSLRSLRQSSSFGSKIPQSTTSPQVSFRIVPNSQGANIQVNSPNNKIRTSLISYSLQNKLRKNVTIVTNQNSTSNLFQVSSTVKKMHPTSNNLLNNTNQKSETGASTKSQTSSIE